MSDSPAAFAHRLARTSAADRLLLITPGPHGPQILSDLLITFSTNPLTLVDSSLDRLRASNKPRRIRAAATRLPFHRHAFDAILSFEALFSIRPPWTVLAEFHRVLVPDGKLILFEPQSLGLLSTLRDKVSGPGKRVFPLDEIKSRLTRGDFAVDQVEELRAVKNYPRPAFCIRAIKRENPVEPVPQFLTAKEMLERRTKPHPKGEELP